MAAETALTRATGQKLRVDPSPLKEALLHRDDEIHELRQVIAMKDGIIRSLGEKLGLAETATEVISMKDEVIRQLQAELEDLRGSFQDGPSPNGRGMVPFTAIPIPQQAYVPSDSTVDRCIADFSNHRRNLILFTRLEAEGYYLYGRMLVRCFLDEAGEEARVLVHPVQSESHEIFFLEDFVRLFEAPEHQELDKSFQRAAEQRTEPLTHLSTVALAS